MTISFYVVDAFTDKPFAGNPAAVCLLDVPLDEELMKSIAAEMNLSGIFLYIYFSLEFYNNIKLCKPRD